MTRWVLIFSLLAPGLYLLVNIAYLVGAIIVGNDLQTFNQIFGYSLWLPAIAALGAWLLGIVDTARRGLWGWFVVVLLLPVLGSLIYSIATLRVRRPQIA
jgi:hypothetical protein